METVSEKISTLEHLIKGHKNLIQVTETNMRDSSFYERSRERLVKLIEQYTHELEVLDHSHSHGPDIIKQAYEDIRRCRSKLAKLKRVQEIEQLIELQMKIKELQASCVFAGCETVFDPHGPCTGMACAIIEVNGHPVAVCEDCQAAFETFGNDYYRCK